MRIKRSLLIITIYGLICFFVIGCGYSEPPLEFTPAPEIIEKAIKIELEQKYKKISQQLKTKPPQFKITKINVNLIKPTIKFELPTYHLEGNCQIIQKRRKSKSKKITHNFKIDLQRQSAGKTWRIIIPYYDNRTIKYHSYKV